MISHANTNDAHALTAGDVFETLSQDERYSYIAGAIEGLAYSRFLRERPDQADMKCMQNWFYEGGTQSWDTIKAWFKQHEEKSAETVLYAILSKECGK